jgi:hypothetical protein
MPYVVVFLCPTPSLVCSKSKTLDGFLVSLAVYVRGISLMTVRTVMKRKF